MKQEVTFAGNPSERLDVFLRGLARVRRLVPISDVGLLTVLPILLTGPANRWFEARSSTFTTWAISESGLREVYQPADYDLLMQRDQFLSTQAPGERIDNFLSVLINVNATLTTSHFIGKRSSKSLKKTSIVIINY